MLGREFSSGGVIIKIADSDIKVLLIEDSYGHWTWPKGNIEKGETSEQAAIREISEEVGLTNVRLIEKIDKVQYFYRLKGRLIFKIVYIYLFEANGNEGLKVLKSEIEDAQWLSSKEALQKIEYKGAKKILKKAIDRFKENCQKKI
ncbi:MAG: NUDIX domain-containing protein [Candidatus Omnitrophica bacterium]|nr:NUDIX domain-containing protein [Candidatus Omnitrophota bacterium]